VKLAERLPTPGSGGVILVSRQVQPRRWTSSCFLTASIVGAQRYLIAYVHAFRRAGCSVDHAQPATQQTTADSLPTVIS
jgi:hypothetical protein